MKTTKRITFFAMLAIVQLLFIQCSDKKEMATSEPQTITKTIVVQGTDSVHSIRIAYVSYDSLLANYSFAKEIQMDMLRKEMSINNTIEEERKVLQKEAAEFERKVQNNLFLSQETAQAEYDKIMKKDQELLQRGQAMIANLEQESNELYAEMTECVNRYIKEYNDEHGYDFILTKIGGNMLYANEAYDITADIVEGLNAKYSKGLGE